MIALLLPVRRALAIRQRTLGPEHPEVAQSLNNVGTALASQGKHAAAEQVGYPSTQMIQNSYN